MANRQARAVIIGITQSHMIEGSFGYGHIGGVASEAIRKADIDGMGNGLGQRLSGKGYAAACGSYWYDYQCKG
jgi:hypothetical protein